MVTDTVVATVTAGHRSAPSYFLISLACLAHASGLL